MRDHFHRVSRTVPGVPFRNRAIAPSCRVSPSIVSASRRQAQRWGAVVAQGDQGRYRSTSLLIGPCGHEGRPSALLNRLMARFRGQSRTARDPAVRWGKSTGLSQLFWTPCILFDECQTEWPGMPVIPDTRRLAWRAPAEVFVRVAVDMRRCRDIVVCECGRARTPGRCCWQIVQGSRHG